MTEEDKEVRKTEPVREEEKDTKKVELNNEEEGESIPLKLAKRLMTISLVSGLIGGLGGGYLALRYLPQGLLPAERQVVLQENSAVIDVIEKTSPSVVSISARTNRVNIFGLRSIETGAGTGIILSEDGLILTNKHVVPENSTFSVFTADGKEHEARVVARDPLNDIAFLRIDARGLKPAEIGDSSSIEVGQKVVAIGNALGRFKNTATEGIVSGLGRPITAGSEEGTEDLVNLIQTDAAINPGNSGGPLVNLSGQVIGVNTAIAGNAQNIGFAIPINEVKVAIDSVKAEGRIIRPYLGVRYVPLTKEFATANNLKVSEGAYISTGDEPGVIPGGPADKAGLREGDIITHVAGTKVDDKNSLGALIGRHKVGDRVELTIKRGDGETKITVTLEEAR
jgi:serine protease Do